MTRAAAVVASVLVAVALLAALSTQVDPARAWAAASEARPGWVLAVLGAFALNQALRIVRWHALLSPPTPLSRTATIGCVAFLGILVLPLRLGEAIRPALHARDGIPLGRALAAVVVERVFDLVALLVLLLWVAVGADLPEVRFDGAEMPIHAASRVVATTVLAALVGVAVLVPLGPRLGGVPVIGPVLVGWSAALAELARAPARAAITAALTALTWMSTVLYVWCALHAIPGLPTGLGAATVAWAGVMAAITVLPTPGFFGSYEAGFVAGLHLYGAPTDTAAAAALGLHLLYVAFVAALGIPAAASEGDTWAAAMRTPAPEPDPHDEPLRRRATTKG